MRCSLVFFAAQQTTPRDEEERGRQNCTQLFSVLMKPNTCYSLMPRRPQKTLQWSLLKENLLIDDSLMFSVLWKEIKVSVLEIRLVAAAFFVDIGFWGSFADRQSRAAFTSITNCKASVPVTPSRITPLFGCQMIFISHSFMNSGLFCVCLFLWMGNVLQHCLK